MGRSLIPPVQVTDSLDKPNASNTPKDTSYIWIIGGIIAALIIYFGSYFMLMARWDYVIATSYNSTNIAIATFLSYATPIIYFCIVIAAAIYILRHIAFISNRQKLINIHDTQLTIDMLNNPNAYLLAAAKMEVEKTRAATIKYPNSVLSVQDSNNQSVVSEKKENTSAATLSEGLLPIGDFEDIEKLYK